MKLWLVRHGQTQANLDKRYSGQSETPLTPVGLDQALAVGEKLQHLSFDKVFCGESGRVQQTTQRVLQQRKLPVITTPLVNEMFFGDWEMHSALELTEKYPTQYAAWCDDWQNVVPPAGESFTAFYQRIAQFIAQLKCEDKQANILVVSHQGVLSLLICQLLKLPPEAMWSFAIEQGAWSEIQLYEDFAVLQCLNNRAPASQEI
ncbi:adenosylcobalamin/alpha-ribazole phosphatase [Citrobacter sp. JGM124]|uniref:adenosylcobalamin/alpha-ribazole phosphatase n=1 Tax=Citrobacter sp. JGM124 TaxID=2799789 RepID=UPI001BABFD00|nr:adenosylcobalamin/alpha-ribazole phosphatase [Citrobacter sp. JGM124]MBS0848630.1 adenosylcobalamin/alpha-ribazole phosphatase [Citrobacter sp. JGM124]